MSSEPNNDANRRPPDGVKKCTYDARGRLTRVTDMGGEVMTYQYDTTKGRVAVPGPAADAAPSAMTPAQPLVTHTFEFRRTASETREQCLPLASGLRPAELFLATGAVRAYLTRTGEPAATSAIGG